VVTFWAKSGRKSRCHGNLHFQPIKAGQSGCAWPCDACATQLRLPRGSLLVPASSLLPSTSMSTMDPHADLVVVFRAPAHILNKQHARDEAAQAEQQYTRLLSVLSSAGLKAVGRAGDPDDQLLVFIRCPGTLLTRLVRRERCAHCQLSSISSCADVFSYAVGTLISSMASRPQHCLLLHTISTRLRSLRQNVYALYTHMLLPCQPTVV
jgi:hypothetical protein